VEWGLLGRQSCPSNPLQTKATVISNEVRNLFIMSILYKSVIGSEARNLQLLTGHASDLKTSGVILFFKKLFIVRECYYAV